MTIICVLSLESKIFRPAHRAGIPTFANRPGRTEEQSIRFWWARESGNFDIALPIFTSETQINAPTDTATDGWNTGGRVFGAVVRRRHSRRAHIAADQ